jgi:DNA polymerase (family 10)
MTKDDVAAALDEIGVLLQLQGENDFRVRAYTNGARLVSQFQGDFKSTVAAGKLAEIRGIGDALAQKITTLVTTGRLPYLEELRASVPPGLLEILRIPGIGPKKVKAMHTELGIDSVTKLKAACEAGEVAKLKGFGEKTQEKILAGITFLDSVGQRVRIDVAEPVAEAILSRLRALPDVIRAEVCGSLRRRRETTKDIDIVASSKNPEAVTAAFAQFPEVFQVIGQGPHKCSVVVRLAGDGRTITLNSDLLVVTDDQFPFAVLHFTGSKEHNIRLRQRAIDRGWLLNENGLGNEQKQVKAKTEADIYKALGLPLIPAELRQDTGEVEAAEAKSLPKLVEYADIRGVFHNHTIASDGTATLEDMARKCMALGWEYFGVGDHSQSLTVASGLSPARVKKQWEEADALNKKLKGFQIFKGTECDILLDGSLDYDDELLEGFDYVVASVHAHFALSEEEQTARVCKALQHPATTMLGHATGRLLLRREGYKIDLDRVIRTAADHGKMIEINAQPSRLDLDWTYVKRAKELGVMIVINPDAHSTGELELTRYGVDVARRGWLTMEEVFNTRGVKEVMAEFKKRKK